MVHCCVNDPVLAEVFSSEWWHSPGLSLAIIVKMEAKAYSTIVFDLLYVYLKKTKICSQHGREVLVTRSRVNLLDNNPL